MRTGPVNAESESVQIFNRQHLSQRRSKTEHLVGGACWGLIEEDVQSRVKVQNSVGVHRRQTASDADSEWKKSRSRLEERRQTQAREEQGQETRQKQIKESGRSGGQTHFTTLGWARNWQRVGAKTGHEYCALLMRQMRQTKINKTQRIQTTKAARSICCIFLVRDKTILL